MTKIILTVTEEELDNLDRIGLFMMDKAGVFYQSITILPIDTESEVSQNEN